jgi:hypothetical protein
MILKLTIMKNHLSSFFAILSILVSFSLSAQDDVYKAMLKRTSVAIHKAQKTMIASKTTDVGGKLAKAVLLQSHAVKLYEQKKQGEAASNSALARELASGIIKELSGKTDAFFVITDEEKKLITESKSENELLKEGKNSLKEFAGKSDKDYSTPSSLNTSNIDIK